MKYKIEKNTVQETLILPLYSRKLCTELYPNLYRDKTAGSFRFPNVLNFIVVLSGRQTTPCSSLFQVLRLRTVSPAVFSN